MRSFIFCFYLYAILGAKETPRDAEETVRDSSATETQTNPTNSHVHH